MFSISVIYIIEIKLCVYEFVLSVRSLVELGKIELLGVVVVN